MRVGYVTYYTCGVLLFVLSVGFILFIPEVADFFENFAYYGSGLKWIGVFTVGASMFALCYAFLIWRFFRGWRSVMKRGAYLTKTQVIEAVDGLIRYRNLKDASEISVNKFQGGLQTSLDVKFPDGDFYKLKLFMNKYYDPIPKQIIYANEWQEKAVAWRNEAASAALRGDIAYFDSQDIIPRSAEAVLPIHGKLIPAIRVMRTVSLLSFAMLVFVLIIGLTLEISKF